VRTIRLASALALAAMLSLTASPVGARTAVSVSSPLDVTNDQWANNEESLGMSPDGSLLAGSWNDWEYNDGCGFAYSSTGGSNWAHETFVPGMTAFTNDPEVPGTGRFDVAGDPAVVYNPSSGVFDVVCQAFGTKTGNQIQLLSTTFDPALADPNADENFSYGTQVGGFPAWTEPVVVPASVHKGSFKGSNGSFPDHETIYVDTGTGAGHHFGRLFVGWVQFSGNAGKSPVDIAFSDDDGQTWTGPIRVSDKGNQFDQDVRPSVGPDGTVYVTWVNTQTSEGKKGALVMADRSTNGALTWGPDRIVATVEVPIPGTLPNSHYRVFEDAWSSVDQVRGTVQVAYTDEKSGAANIYVTHNLTPGDLSQWSIPQRVKPSSNEQFFPWISSAPNGRVDLVYYDRTCDSPDTRNCVTLSFSTNGGLNWTNVPLTTVGFDGDLYNTCLEFVQPPDCGRNFLGDYIAVSSANQKAAVLWTGNGPDAMDVFSQQVT
jgi:hypothetical protein